jgi:hypothetical protein
MSEVRVMRRFAQRLLLGTALLSSSVGANGAAWGYSPTETFVIDKVGRGEWADLKRFPDPKDRVLNATFVEDLLTDTFPT